MILAVEIWDDASRQLAQQILNMPIQVAFSKQEPQEAPVAIKI